ncbi:MAG: CDP-diacylglycerol--glycerol-3-phosphate 3-phosphatidyltransferase [Pseudanabaenaceae cyanobacterium SKYGB_i_bin29]|nr:CDP-diacylglycerol--glycerol-3-phosphate 3-phosphatidyltransferase [Pseudanabaenaceae cyanobacterium SKYG29]MDW8421770.1 CDP-diacylglycerol--glycerol-3-phosphate 3-phosphatidyltransferase [Pseudanabaenaceae cyanobacterium SKYGB_i_bin29]
MVKLGSPALTLANAVTLSRLLVVPFILALLTWEDSIATRSWCAALVGVAGITDWLDGYVARKWQQESELGKILDPLVDKLVVFAPLLMLVELGEIPAWGVYIILAREFLITLWRAPKQSGANLWGKVKTTSQIIAILLLLLRVPYALWSFWLAVVLTVISGITYVFPVH